MQQMVRYEKSKILFCTQSKLNQIFVLIDGRNFYDQLISSDITKYEELLKLTIGRGENYETGCLLESLLNYIPNVLSCPTCLVPYVLSCLVPYVLSCLMCPVPYVLSCPTCSRALHVSCPMWPRPSCFMSPFSLRTSLPVLL